RRPCWPYGLLGGEFVLLLAMLARGVFVMRNPGAGRCRKNGGRFGAFLALIALLCAGGVTLMCMRPFFSANMHAEGWNEQGEANGTTGTQWSGFDVRYPDSYYLTLSVEADAPANVRIVNGAGEAVYEGAGERIAEKNLRLSLARGHYDVMLSGGPGRMDIKMSID
ncbi:MAG: hypothetical protein J5998_05230, partial [Clostridia bacterium]|nr:hypothetical protein [Clostridia bacterium]